MTELWRIIDATRTEAQIGVSASHPDMTLTADQAKEAIKQWAISLLDEEPHPPVTFGGEFGGLSNSEETRVRNALRSELKQKIQEAE